MFPPTNTRSTDNPQQHRGLHAPWVPMVAVLIALAGFSLLSGWMCLLVLAFAFVAVLLSLFGHPAKPNRSDRDQQSPSGSVVERH